MKTVATSEDEAMFCSVTIKPNFQALRERAAPKLKPIGEALKQWSTREIAELERGSTIEVVGVAIGMADVLLTRVPVPGSVVASQGDVTVVLDPVLTPELVQEGLAREFNSVLQQARKSAGLEVSDRIRVVFHSAAEEVRSALTRHRSSISDEVLAVEFRLAEHEGEASESADLNGLPVRYAISKA